GKDVCSYPATELRKKIGIVPQKAILFKGTLRENLLQGNPDATDAELEAAIRTAQGGEILEKSESGLDQPVEQGGKNFSGGQRQRLTIARALVRKPEILILDDSASALDFATDAALRQAIRNLEERPATVIVSQRTSSIAHADKILVLEDGAAVGYGDHETLLKACPVYREIHESQFKKEARA
ncbi:MAG: ABC transporter ATP-binding protein, partial [Clostridia bacterium]|nr:ABC transporter ATP-binding protein [Clostridia bacterium]